MTDNGDNYWKDEVKELKRELKELRKELKYDIRRDVREAKRSARRARKAGYWPMCSTDFNFDHAFDFSESFGQYLESVLGSVFGSIDAAFSGVFEHGHGPRSRRERRKRRFRSIHFTDEQREQFIAKAPELCSLLADSSRLKLMELLESGPKYQSDLADDKIQGGTFKHHMQKLIDAGWVIQEKARGRYLITINGREALKFAEFLFTRSNPEFFDNNDEKKPVDRKPSTGADVDIIENENEDHSADEE
ncbi:MAG: winged helix-turn-helix domain-containing protein [Candidatus Odinarchaeota archaeon]